LNNVVNKINGKELSSHFVDSVGERGWCDW